MLLNIRVVKKILSCEVKQTSLFFSVVYFNSFNNFLVISILAKQIGCYWHSALYLVYYLGLGISSHQCREDKENTRFLDL